MEKQFAIDLTDKTNQVLVVSSDESEITVGNDFKYDTVGNSFTYNDFNSFLDHPYTDIVI